MSNPAPVPATSSPETPPAGRRNHPGVFVGLGLVIVGFALALIPLLGVIGWPLMLAGLVLGIVGAAKRWGPAWANVFNIVLGFVGPGLAIILIISGAVASSNATEPGARNEPAAEQPAVTGDDADADAGADDAVTPDGPSFVNGVLTTDDVRIEITEHRVIPVGAAGNEYGSSPVIAFWYSVTNLSGKETTATTAFMFSIAAFQDNDPNAENKLSVGLLPDPQFRDSQLQKIKKDGTVQNAIAFQLDDETTPVDLVGSAGLFGGDLGTTRYTLG